MVDHSKLVTIALDFASPPHFPLFHSRLSLSVLLSWCSPSMLFTISLHHRFAARIRIPKWIFRQAKFIAGMFSLRRCVSSSFCFRRLFVQSFLLLLPFATFSMCFHRLELVEFTISFKVTITLKQKCMLYTKSLSVLIYQYVSELVLRVCVWVCVCDEEKSVYELFEAEFAFWNLSLWFCRMQFYVLHVPEAQTMFTHSRFSAFFASIHTERRLLFGQSCSV